MCLKYLSAGSVVRPSRPACTGCSIQPKPTSAPLPALYAMHVKAVAVAVKDMLSADSHTMCNIHRHK